MIALNRFIQKLHYSMTNLKSSQLHYLVGLGISVIFFILYTLLMLHKYWQFEYFFIDNVYFHSALWKLSQFEAPMVHHRLLGEINIFGDHFHPTIILVAILMRFFPWNETVFVIMSLTYAIGGYIIFLVGLKLIKNKAILYLLMLSYYLYIGTQNAFMFGFHEINLVPLFFAITIWGLINKKYLIYVVGLVLLLLTKESMAIVGMALGLFIVLSNKNLIRIGIVTIIASSMWFIIVTRLIIPHFSDGRFLYTEVSYPQSASQIVTRLIDPPQKIHTFMISISSFGLLPILNVAASPLVYQDFLTRYLVSIPNNIQYTLTYHYGVALAPMLLVSSIWSIRIIEKNRRKGILLLLAIILCGGLTYSQLGLEQRAPILLTLNQEFYRNTNRNAFLWELVEAVPSSGTVMTQNHLGLPLSRQTTYMLALNYKDLMKIYPDYLVYDLRPGQNPNNYYPISESQWKIISEQAIKSGDYRTIFSKHDMVVLERNH